MLATTVAELSTPSVPGASYVPPAGEQCNPPFDPSSIDAATWDQYAPVVCDPSDSPLYDAEPNDVIELELQADFDQINDPSISSSFPDAATSPGTVTYNDPFAGPLTIPITLQARGNSRFDYCAMRPLVMVFNNHQVGNIFENASKKVKITTHCGNHPIDPWILGGTPEEQRRRLLAEYYFYRVLDKLDSTGLATRLAHITYKNDDGTIIASEYAFFREKEDYACERCGFVDELPDEESTAGYTADETSLFQADMYNAFVYNEDYSPMGRHNTRICYDSGDNLFFIPYDWDLTGVVRPDYFKNGIPYQEKADEFWAWLQGSAPQARTQVQAWQIYAHQDEMRDMLRDTLMDEEGQNLLQDWLELYTSVVDCYLGTTDQKGDKVGASQATCDFNGDGYKDLAYGIPGEDIGSTVDAGAVGVLYGSSNGLQVSSPADQVWMQSSGLQDASEEGDRFGAAVAAGDFNNDGFCDLAVGAPEETVGTVAGAGAVNVLYGSSNGLRTSSPAAQFWHQDSTNVPETAEAGDRLGAALAVGNFNGDAYVDLAIGAPGETVGTVEDAGGVIVLYGSSSGLSASSPAAQAWDQDSTGIGGTAENRDYFGAALAAGDFNKDGRTDLAVGVPGEAIGDLDDAGAVSVIYGSASGLQAASPSNQTWHQNAYGVDDDAESFDEFGTALAAGDFNLDGVADLAIGVPGESVGAINEAGIIHVLYGSQAGSGLQTSSPVAEIWHQDSPDIGGSCEYGDRFGSALVAGDFTGDGAADLAVSAPNEDIGTISDAGAVFILPGGGAGGLMESNACSCKPSKCNDCTSALATCSATAGCAEIVACVQSHSCSYPGENCDAGRSCFDITGYSQNSAAGQAANGIISCLGGCPGIVGGATSQVWHQNALGGEETCEVDDRFGYSLAAGDFDGNGTADLSAGIPFEDVGAVVNAGHMNVLYSSGGELQTTNPAIDDWNQGTSGVEGTVE